MKTEKVTGETPIQEDPMNSMPVLVEAFADNGEFSHWRLVDRQTSELLWTECPEEDAILYTGFKVQEHKPESEESVAKSLTIYKKEVQDRMKRMEMQPEYINGHSQGFADCFNFLVMNGFEITKKP